MTQQSWKAEHYPVPALKLKNASDAECLEHTILKFKGARKEALEKHGASIEGAVICFLNPYSDFYFDSFMCSLCEKNREDNGCINCKKCPIGISGNECNKDDGTDPYTIFQMTDNPNPMIELCERLLEENEKK